MVVDRNQAKQQASPAEPSDPQLDTILSDAGALRVALEKEANRHREVFAKDERGKLGSLLGGESSAPVTIAFIAILIGSLVWIACLIAAYCLPDQADFWSTQANRALAFSLTALGYVFGKGSSK